MPVSTCKAEAGVSALVWFPLNRSFPQSHYQITHLQGAFPVQSPLRLPFRNWMILVQVGTNSWLSKVTFYWHMSENFCCVILFTESLSREMCCTSCNQSERGFYAGLYSALHEVMTVIKTTDRGTWRCQAAVNVRAFPTWFAGHCSIVLGVQLNYVRCLIC